MNKKFWMLSICFLLLFTGVALGVPANVVIKGNGGFESAGLNSCTINQDCNIDSSGTNVLYWQSYAYSIGKIGLSNATQTEGSNSLFFYSKTTAGQSGGLTIINDYNFFGGQIYFDCKTSGSHSYVDFGYITASGDITYPTGCSSADGTGWVARDFNLPVSIPSRLVIRFINNIQLETNNGWVDNIRWSRKPVLSDYDFNVERRINVSQNIDVNFNSGYSCYIKDNTGIRTDLSWVGNDTYRTTFTNTIPTLKDYNQIKCFSGSETYDTNYKANDQNNDKIGYNYLPTNQYSLLTNGSFEQGCNKRYVGTTESGGCDFTGINGWDLTQGGQTTYHILGYYSAIKSTGWDYAPTDKHYYFNWYSDTSESTGNFTLKNTTSLLGGTLSFDYSCRTSGQVKYTFDNNAQTITLKSLACNASSGFGGGKWLKDNYTVIPSCSTCSGKVSFYGVKSGFAIESFYLDNVRYSNETTTFDASHTPSCATTSDTITFKAEYLDSEGNPVLNADCNATIPNSNGVGSTLHAMSYNSGTQKYEFSQNIAVADNYSWTAVCGKTNYTNGTETENFGVYANVLGLSPFTITDISNVSHSYSYSLDTYACTETTSSNRAIFTPNDQSGEIEFSIYNPNSVALQGDFNILNSLLDGKRYFIYTANQADYDAGIWNLEDTLTYGSIGAGATYDDGLQKLWDLLAQRYNYTFSDTLNPLETKYYKIAYQNPLKSWSTLNPNNQTDWDLAYLPNGQLENDGGHSWDYWLANTYANIRNQYRIAIPAIINSSVLGNYILAFNAYSDGNSGSGILQSGTNQNAVDVSYDLNVQTTQKTFTVETGSDYPFIKTSVAKPTTIYLSDYSLMDRAFFSKPLTVNDKFDQEIRQRYSLGGAFGKFIKEGEQFKIKSQVYDRDGRLDYLEAKVYLNGTGDNNQVAYFRKDFNGSLAGQVYDVDWLVNGITDLLSFADSGNNQTVYIQLKAVDTVDNYFVIQSQAYKLEQFPANASDFFLTGNIINTVVGQNPTISFKVRTEAPETLRAIKMYIYQNGKSYTNADYNTTFWKDIDFTCNAFICTLTKTIQDFAFQDDNQYTFLLTGLLTTQAEDFNRENINLTAYWEQFFVNYKTWETAKILETLERQPDHKYRNDEPINLVLILRESGEPVSLKDTITTAIKISVCDSQAPTDDCTLQDVTYSPKSFAYEPQTGYNYWFFRDVFTNEDGTLLTDGKYYRVVGIVNDLSGKHDAGIIPVLTTKCTTYDVNFWGISLGGTMNFGWGCIVPQTSVVSYTTGLAQENRLLIDMAYSPQSPTFEAFGCVNTDKNNVYVDQLKQDLTCVGIYKFNELPIDYFNFYLTNAYSDLSKTGVNAQYIKVQVPFETLALNDIQLMRESLALNYGTKAKTIQELAWQGLNAIASPVGNVFGNWTAETFFNSSGFIKNVGWTLDLNKALDPTYISGIIFFRVKGVKVINIQDYTTALPDVNLVDPSDFVQYANTEKVILPTNTTTVEILGSDMSKLATYTSPSMLVINEAFSDQTINKENLDINSSSKYSTLPTQLTFYAIVDMIFNNEQSAKRLFLPFIITTIIQPKPQTILEALGTLFTDPGAFAVKYWFAIFICAIAILLISIVYSRFKGNSTTINTGG